MQYRRRLNPVSAIFVVAFALAIPCRLAASKLPYLLFDVNGDQKLEEIKLFSDGTHKTVQISLGGSETRSLQFETEIARRGRVLVWDINGDHNLDVIWVSRKYPDAAVVWLGNGHGDFQIVSVVGPYLPDLHALLSQRSTVGFGAQQPISSDLSAIVSNSFSLMAVPGWHFILSDFRFPSLENVEHRNLDPFLSNHTPRGPPPTHLA